MFKSIALFIISASIFQAKCDLYTCSRLSNCLCRGEDKVFVFCRVYNNLNILPELFHDLHGRSITVLKLTDCAVDYLQNNLFINASINALTFNCPFDELEEDSLSSINSLEFLLMNMTRFAKIPSAITKLRNLKTLKLVNGQLTAVSRELQNMTNLQRLRLWNNRIQEIASDAFIFHKNLVFLDISNNRIKFLHPNMFQHCTNIQGFKVAGNYLESTDGIPRGDKIELLYLRDNAFHTIKFARYVNIETLDISQNSLRLLPKLPFHYNFPRLKKLYINSCGLSILPSMLLEMLNHLEYIHLGFNGILRIPPKFFQNLRRLKTVMLRNNKLEHLEDNIFEDCRNITYVTLKHNRLKSLGNAFKPTSKLNKLFLGSNDFEVLKEDEFKYFTSLEYLDIGRNKITCLETNVFLMMTKIKELRLDWNRISSLNHSLNSLRSLETLFLNSNQLEVIIESDLLGLVQLKALHLDRNKLMNVNGAFRTLSNLRYLDLRRNRLHTLAKNSFPENPSLLELSVLLNKWECDCRLLWLRELVIKRNSTGKSLHCWKPKRFQMRELVSLSVSDLVQWPEECPPFCNCSCVGKEDGNFFVKVHCSRTNMSEFPSALPERTGELNLNDNLLTRLNFSKKTLRNLKTLDAERNHLNSLNFEIPKSITTMKLAGNKLTRFFDKPPPNIFLWTLAENPWICDCETINFRIWMLQQTSNILDVKNIRCGNHTSRKFLQNKAIIDLLDSDLCPSVVSTIIIASVSILVLLLLGTSSGLFYYRYRYHIKVWLYCRGLTWLKKEDEEDHGKIYDAFISAADEDILWVKDVLLPELEDKHPYYTIYEPTKHMLGGEMCPYEKELEVASKSRRVIVLISRNYIENNLLMGIFKACFVNSLEEKKYRFILIIIGDLPPLSDMDQSLRAAIESTKYLRFGQKLFWEMLRFAMPKKTRKIDEHVREETSEDVPLLQ